MEERILIIDDEPFILYGLERAVKSFCSFRWHITTVHNGKEALARLQNNFYHICFLDIKLPDVSGLDIMHHIRRISLETEIVVISGCSFDDEQRREIETHSSLFIEKPTVVAEVEKFLKQSLGTEIGLNIPGKDDIIGKRRYRRRPAKKIIRYTAGISGWLQLVGNLIDISYTGLGMLTNHPLEKGHSVQFNEGLAHKKGSVSWSRRLSDNRYRTGIHFADYE